LHANLAPLLPTSPSSPQPIPIAEDRRASSLPVGASHQITPKRRVTVPMESTSASFFDTCWNPNIALDSDQHWRMSGPRLTSVDCSLVPPVTSSAPVNGQSPPFGTPGQYQRLSEEQIGAIDAISPRTGDVNLAFSALQPPRNRQTPLLPIQMNTPSRDDVHSPSAWTETDDDNLLNLLPSSQCALHNAPRDPGLTRTVESKCHHRKSWKRLRSKRGFAYFACQFCGAKWRITTHGIHNE
jgi:hypothetical protein